MRTTGTMGPGTEGPDDGLGRELDAGLRAGLDDGRVDVASLLVGARQGARRIRRRRRAGTALGVVAVLAAAVPVGAGLIGSDVAPPFAASGPSPGPTPSAPPTAVLVPPVTPSSVPSFTTAENGSVDVPLEAMLSGEELPIEGPPDDQGSRLGVLTLGTLVCAGEPEPAAEADLGGRQLLFQGEDGQSVVSSVRVVEGAAAGEVQASLADALGRCDSPAGPWQLQPTESLPGEAPVLALAEEYAPGVHYVVGSLREGGTVVGVSVRLRGTPDEVVATAGQLLVRAYEKLVASGLPQAYPG